MSEKMCNVVRDLLPLYVEGCCSEESRRLVEEHLAGCEDCRRAHREMTVELPAEELPAEGAGDRQAGAAMKKGLKKIRHRWQLSLAALAAAFVVLPLGWNQIRGRGICFGNLRALWTADAFLRDLKAGDLEGAYGRLDIAGLREDWLAWEGYDREKFNEETLSNMEADGLEIFLRSAQELVEMGGVTEYHYLSAERQVGRYDLEYHVEVAGEEYRLILGVEDGGVREISFGQRLSAPLGRLEGWSEWLWESYAGCYLDLESGQYVYSAPDIEAD